MIDVNGYISDRLREQEIYCQACEWPEPADAGDGPYITWRKTSVEQVYASGEVWSTTYRVQLTLWSPLVELPDCDNVTREHMEKLLTAFDARGDDGEPSCYVSAANLQGDYVAAVGRRAYDLAIAIREE